MSIGRKGARQTTAARRAPHTSLAIARRDLSLTSEGAKLTKHLTLELLREGGGIEISGTFKRPDRCAGHADF